VQKGAFLLAAFAALLTVAGCPPAQKKTAEVDQPAPVVGEGAVSGTPVAADTSEAGDTDIDVDVEVNSGDGKSASAEQPKLDAVPEEDELKGRWFALYGRSGISPAKYTYEDGHIVEFLGNGKAAWIIRRGGAPISNIPSSFSLQGDRMSMEFDPALDTSREFGQYTPLGFGRDQEIGLLSAGRDDEIGLAESRKDKAPKGPALLDFEVSSDGQFLSIKGGEGQLMVYGREDVENADEVPDFNGEWTGHMSRTEIFPADFKLKGKNLEVKYGKSGMGSFRGSFTHGYFVGEMVSEREASFAALTPTENGAINGVYSPDPFNDIRLHFDFTRKQ
jgi:hypothetical protein